MTKSTPKSKAPRLKRTTTETLAGKNATATLSNLREDPDLWYRIRILLYDLNNVKNPLSSNRLSSTTNELYISEPYFREHEASKIRTALISKADVPDLFSNDISPETQEITIEQALHHNLENFLEKRKASGDSRPCGPHDMVPIYGSVFGIRKEELGDERFLGRLRRSGVGDSGVGKGGVGAAAEGARGGSRKLSRRGGKG